MKMKLVSSENGKYRFSLEIQRTHTEATTTKIWRHKKDSFYMDFAWITSAIQLLRSNRIHTYRWIQLREREILDDPSVDEMETATNMHSMNPEKMYIHIYFFWFLATE